MKILNNEHYIIAEASIDRVEKFPTNDRKLVIDEEKIDNFFFDFNIPKMGYFLKVFEKKLEFNLNEMESLEDKLNVKNLSIIFPELAKLYPTEPNKTLKVDLKIKIKDRSPLLQRDDNLFLMTNIEIDLSEMNEEKTPICSLSMKNYINLMINSSKIYGSHLYFNEPNLRIIDIVSENCKFEVKKQTYIKTLENLFRINLLSVKQAKTEIMEKFFTGPFIKIDNDLLKIGLNINYDF